MTDKNNGTPAPSTAEIAREAFRRLVARRISPTPEAYREIYDEVAGSATQSPAEKILADLAASLMRADGEVARAGKRMAESIGNRDWRACAGHVGQLAERHLAKPAAPPPGAGAVSVSLVDEPKAAKGRPLPIALVERADTAGAKQAQLLRDMLVRSWSFPIVSMLHGRPELIGQANALIESIRTARSEHELAAIDAVLRQLCFRIEFKSSDLAEENELLLRLLKLLLENIGELLEDDSWLSGQLAGVRELLSGTVDYGALAAIALSLKEVIYKQSLVKHNLSEAKATLKSMIVTFVDRLEAFTETTGAYQDKIDGYVRQVGDAESVADLNRVLEQVMFDTRSAQADAVRAREQMIAVRHEVRSAESRVDELESELRQMSERVYEDHLTGALNRRGLDDALERTLARAERRDLPVCIAMLDLDDFKRLNDIHGHDAGDGALVYLVQVVKDALRAMDVVARFGGEEFVIVLPDTALADAARTVTRVQRELTKRIFMHNHERLLITFSAGVALRTPGEDQASLIRRADEALYRAKKSGKNRVVAAR